MQLDTAPVKCIKPILAFLTGIPFLVLPVAAQNNHSFIRRLHPAPLSVLQVDLKVKVSPAPVKACAFLRFYDSLDHELLEYKSAPVSSDTLQETGFYTEAPPYTNYATVSVEPDSGKPAEITVEGFHADPQEGVPEKKFAPLCDLDQYMRPFWKSDTIFNETVLLYSRNGMAATGRLLFQPDKILSVQRFDLKTTYSEKEDYFVNGRTIGRRPNSKMPFRADTSFNTRDDLAWFNLQSQWVVVTYTHRDKWEGQVPAYKGNSMPRTLAKLRSKSPLRIVGYGMSITRGLDVSSYDTVAPFMPTYLQLFTRALKKQFGYGDIQLYNAGLPGAKADWGASYADQYINPLKPDLVIIDFGMNDFWIYKPEEFSAFIQTIIQKVKRANPEAEFLLLSNMKFDPDYVLDPDKNKAFYLGNMEGYNTGLQKLVVTGITDLDMTTISGYIYSRKKAKDCLANPLHPNDYLARWYAQGMAAIFRK
ncbi:MAG TPA: GDSL-type esterase/lipase family protein [Puia sp.]